MDGLSSQLVELTVDHLWLTVPSILLTFLLSLPLGWAAFRLSAQRRPGRRVDAGALITVVTSALYAIPSLALFLLLPVIFGSPILSPFNVVSALFIYGIALQTRVVAEAFAAASSTYAPTMDAATAAGYLPMQRFYRVELPLAGPSILAGLRVVATSTISMASVGALVGVSSLGDLITDGFLRRYPEQILAGTLAIVVLAIVVDVLLVVAGRVLMPWQRALRSV